MADNRATTDLIERLRARRIKGQPGVYNPDELCREAANEIERLNEWADGFSDAQLIQEAHGRLRAALPAPLGLTDAEDLLLEIANSMSKDMADPVEHANWCVEVAKDYFVKKTARGGGK